MNPSPSSMRGSILIAGTVRNCENTIIEEISRLHKCFSPLFSVHFFIVESDSDDKTIGCLENLKRSRENFNWLSLGRLRDRHPLRTERLALCRNAYLDELRSNSKYQDIDYLVVSDLDGVNRLLTEDAVKSCWSNELWGVCTANQDGPYYDIWALRHHVWSPGDCLQQYYFFLQHNIAEPAAKFGAIFSKMIFIAKGQDWIKVDSAFGGLAIYRRKLIESAKYIGLNKLGEEVCEHVGFHSDITSRGHSILINPNLINVDFTDVSEPLRSLFSEVK